MKITTDPDFPSTYQPAPTAEVPKVAANTAVEEL